MMYQKIISLFLLLVLNSSTCTGSPTIHSSSEVKSFVALTKPLTLFPGEVTNSWHDLKIPAGPIAIHEFKADVVEYDQNGNLVPVPLADAYLHHHVVFSKHKKQQEQHWWINNKHKSTQQGRGVGFGAGTESRGTPQKFNFPYAFTTNKGENELRANVHVINTRSMQRTDASLCLECPCTSSETYSNNGTILAKVQKRRHHWNRCNPQLQAEENTACFPELYRGGLLCCEDGEYCLDKYDPNQTVFTTQTLSTFYLRYTLVYKEVVPENRPLFLASCCDASGNETSPGNIEYDIPQCNNGNENSDRTDVLQDDCVHTLSTVQMLHGPSTGVFGSGKNDFFGDHKTSRLVDVVFAVGHLHRGGMEVTIIDESTGETICKSLPTYGDGEQGEIGNEPGYINDMSACTFDPPLRMYTSAPIRVIAKYNSSLAHTGVMGLFYIALAEVQSEGETASSSRGWNYSQAVTVCLGATIVVVASIHVAKEYYFGWRSGYEQVHSIDV